jgi:hypothetical protein
MLGKRLKAFIIVMILALTVVTGAVPTVVLAAACSGSGGGC